MSWDQIRELKKNGVTIGSQTNSHLHMAQASESDNRIDLQASNSRFRAELGNPKYHCVSIWRVQPRRRQTITGGGANNRVRTTFRRFALRGGHALSAALGDERKLR